MVKGQKRGSDKAHRKRRARGKHIKKTLEWKGTKGASMKGKAQTGKAQKARHQVAHLQSCQVSCMQYFCAKANCERAQGARHKGQHRSWKGTVGCVPAALLDLQQSPFLAASLLGSTALHYSWGHPHRAGA